MASVTGFSDDDPSPRADILLTSGDMTGVTTVSVHQVSAAGDFIVRGADRAPAAGGYFVTDYEIPLGIEVTYRAEKFNGSGVSLGFVSAGLVTVNVDPSEVIFSDPLAPKNAARAVGRTEFAGVVQTRRPKQIYRAGVATVALMGESGLVEGVALDVATYTIETSDALEAVLTNAYVLVRSMPNILRLPQVFHCVIAEPVQVPQDVQYGGGWVLWPLVGDQVTRSALQVLEAAVTYQRYTDYYATYADFNAAYSTYLAALQSPPPEA